MLVGSQTLLTSLPPVRSVLIHVGAPGGVLWSVVCTFLGGCAHPSRYFWHRRTRGHLLPVGAATGAGVLGPPPPIKRELALLALNTLEVASRRLHPLHGVVVLLAHLQPLRC
eukprot:2809318-Pyramimonas_sp.AAC.1